jgi:uncharacterized protein YuzE
MKALHNKESDTIIITLNDKQEAGGALIAPDVIAHFDEDDNLVSIEILGASHHIVAPDKLEYIEQVKAR